MSQQSLFDVYLDQLEDEIKRLLAQNVELRGNLETRLDTELRDAAVKIKRLRVTNAELVAALRHINEQHAIAKAGGQE